MSNNLAENKMGVMPVKKLLISMSLPMIASMLVQALYNVIDSIFVAQISENALTAVSLAFPAQNLLIGFATGTGVGVNAILSKSLGEGNREKARKAGENGVFCAICCYVIFLIFGIVGCNLFFKAQTDNAEIISLGVDYLSICCVLSFGVFGQIMFERLLQSTGKTVYTLATQGVGAIVNIIFDPLMIFGIGPFPKMGVKGAALATVLGQIVACIMAIVLNSRFNDEFKLDMKHFRPSGKMIAKIYSVGVPSIIMVGIGSIMTFSMNKILVGFTETAAAVFGVYFKLQSFFFMPLFGMNNGLIPIVAYNYGARKKGRILAVLRFALCLALTIMFLAIVTFHAIPGVLLKLFNATDTMLEIGIPALRIISLSYIFAGFSIILIASFQAFGKGVFSMFVSFARQIVVLIPAAYLFSKTGVLENVWWSFPIAEVASVLVAVIQFIFLYKKVIAPLDTKVEITKIPAETQNKQVSEAKM